MACKTTYAARSAGQPKFSLHRIAASLGCKFLTKPTWLLFLAFVCSLTARAELWTPVGEVDWTEGALTGQNTNWSRTWKVSVERSDERPGVFRLQPYANCPIPIYYYCNDNVYVYLHTENPKKVYIEYYIYNYYYHSSYYHVFQRCPENGFDTQYYGKITDENTIEFPANSFAVDNSNSSSKRDAPSSSAKYSTGIHKIVFPEGVLGYTPPQESWVSIGTGHFVDPGFTYSTGEVVEGDVAVYKSTTRPDVYKFAPSWLLGDLYLHTENPDEVYLEPYSGVNSEDTTITFTQQCTENGSTLSNYGQLTNGVVEIPSEYFVVSASGSSETLTAGRKCIITLPAGYSKPIEGDHGIYMGLVAFNDELKNMPISLLDENTKSDFTGFIDNLQKGNATLLYYAVDQAITTMEGGTYPDNLSNAILITFTDGLDQGSLAMHPEYRTSRDYAATLAGRIGSTSIQGQPLQAYTIGLKGGDVVDDELFMLNLESLSSSSDKAHSANDLTEVEEHLTRLYEELSRQISKRVVSVSVPMLSHGDIYRFTLDHEDRNADNSSLWFEGVFNIDDLSLDSVKYNGFTSRSGDKIVAERNGINLTFTLDDCRDSDNNILDVEKDGIRQWQYIASRDIWQPNSENVKEDDINIEDIKTSAVIVFALDCSNSLGDLFPTVKELANSFIERLAGGDPLTNAIHVVPSRPNGSSATKYYNLQGQEVKNPQRGLYIEVKEGTSRKVYIR